ncbi:MAG: molybdopterin-dependent oxidoreductase [Planctomycetota bacterium]|nr:molybdopterin-dependent oxidoreductase [Planctomycetota bacterium]
MNQDQRTICPFCSMGCTLRINRAVGAPYVGASEIARLEYDEEGRVNRGSLCAKGNMALELLTHASRFESPRVRGADGELERTSWDTALETLGTKLRDIVARHGPRSVGLLLGPTLTNEETVQAAALARAIGTPHVDQARPEDHVVLEGLGRCSARPEPIRDVQEIEACQAILVVGDLFTHAPCIAKPVLHARYDNRRNLLGTLGFWKSRTFLFGKPVLRCLAGREAAALTLFLHMALEQGAGANLPWAAEARAMLDGLDLAEIERLAGLTREELTWLGDGLRDAESSAVLFGCGFAESERSDLTAGLCALLAEATGSRFLAMLGGPNAVGVRSALAAAGFPTEDGLRSAEMLAAAGTGELKALLAFGCDPVGAYPGNVFREAAHELPLLATTAPLDSLTAAAAHVVLPAGTWGEKSGTVVNAFGHEVQMEAVMPPPGTARTDGAIIGALLASLPPSEAEPAGPVEDPADAATFFKELELYLRLEARDEGAREMGTHWLFPEANPGQTGDGWLTGPLSWPRHESPEPIVALSPAHARSLGVRVGDIVRVRSRDASANLAVRIEERLVDDVVLVPPHHPEIRRLSAWRLDGVLRDLDVRPERVTVETLGEETR